MQWQKQRKAFSMITAIFVIVLMSSVAAFIVNLSGKMVKETTAQYQHEQAILLANSYTEYTVMAVTANEHTSTKCLNQIVGSYGDYTIKSIISYIANTTTDISNCANRLNENVQTVNSPLNIIVDVFVQYPDYDHPDDMNMTYHRRTLQKI